jgi:hypothetical protein
MNPSRARPEPASLSKEPRNGRLQDMVQKVRSLCQSPGVAGGSAVAAVPVLCMPPLIDRPTPWVGRPRHIGFVGHSAKIKSLLTMGKQKNRLTIFALAPPHIRHPH